MAKYFKPGKLSQIHCTYFKLEGASSMLYPLRVNSSLADISDGPLKDRHSVTLTEKDTKVVGSLMREWMALQSHLLWLTDLQTTEHSSPML